MQVGGRGDLACRVVAVNDEDRTAEPLDQAGVIVELREVLQFEGGVVTLGPLAAGTFMTTGPS